jgi:hypothetical protein
MESEGSLLLQKGPHLLPILRRMNLLNALPSSFFKINFRIILPTS